MTASGQDKPGGARRVGMTARAQSAIDPLTEPAYLVRVTEPSGGRRVGRIFGYLGLTVLWFVLLAVAVFATIVVLPAMLDSDGTGLGASPGVQRSDAWLGLIIIPFLVAPLIGIFAFFLVMATLGTVLTSATLFLRSLNPAYRHEQLSTTIKSVHGEAVGGVATAFTGVALSQLPVRLTRWTKILLIIQFNGWILNANMLVIGLLWGWLYFFTFGWMLWPATGAAVPVCVVVSILLLALLVVVAWRRRTQFAPVMPERLRGTAYERSWPNRPAEKARTRRKPTSASASAKRPSGAKPGSSAPKN